MLFWNLQLCSLLMHLLHRHLSVLHRNRQQILSRCHYKSQFFMDFFLLLVPSPPCCPFTPNIFKLRMRFLDFAVKFFSYVSSTHYMIITMVIIIIILLLIFLQKDGDNHLHPQLHLLQKDSQVNWRTQPSLTCRTFGSPIHLLFTSPTPTPLSSLSLGQSRPAGGKA